MIQRCGDCGRLRHPPAARCGACGSFDLSYVPSRDPAWSTATAFAATPAGSDLNPAGTVHVVVQLDEGVRLLSNLVGVAPSDVHIGLPVRLHRPGPGVGAALAAMLLPGEGSYGHA